MKTDNKQVIYCIVRNRDNRVIFATENSARLVAFVIVHFPVRSYEFTDMDFIKLTSKNFTMSIVEMNEDCFIED